MGLRHSSLGNEKDPDGDMRGDLQDEFNRRDLGDDDVLVVIVIPAAVSCHLGLDIPIHYTHPYGFLHDRINENIGQLFCSLLVLLRSDGLVSYDKFCKVSDLFRIVCY